MNPSYIKKSENLLDAIDTSVKRLVTPTSFLVAATVVSNGLSVPDSNHGLIYSVIAGLCLLALLYFIFSVGVIENIGTRINFVYPSPIYYG